MGWRKVIRRGKAEIEISLHWSGRLSHYTPVVSIDVVKTGEDDFLLGWECRCLPRLRVSYAIHVSPKLDWQNPSPEKLRDLMEGKIETPYIDEETFISVIEAELVSAISNKIKDLEYEGERRYVCEIPYSPSQQEKIKWFIEDLARELVEVTEELFPPVSRKKKPFSLTISDNIADWEGTIYIRFDLSPHNEIFEKGSFPIDVETAKELYRDVYSGALYLYSPKEAYRRVKGILSPLQGSSVERLLDCLDFVMELGGEIDVNFKPTTNWRDLFPPSDE